MPVYLVSSSQRVYIEVMEMHQKLMPLAYSGYGVDFVEEYPKKKDTTPFVKRFMK